MKTEPFIALLNPAIALVLASAFLALWQYQREARHLPVLAAAFSSSAVGFLLQYFSLPFAGFVITKLASSLAFTVAVVCLAVAILLRYGNRVPYATIMLLAACGMAGFLWFLIGRPDITWRIYSLNFAFGGLCLLIAVELLPVRRNGPVEKALIILALLGCANFVLRTVVAVSLYGPYLSYDGFYSSVYWTTTQLGHAVFSLLIALCLLTATALDIMGKLRTESHTDPLSKLLNRRGFEERAAALLERSAEANVPVALVLADLDHFKAVNDIYGHAAGDSVISEFAGRLRHVAGGRGVAGRIGGEEFAVLLPLVDLGAARLFAETVRTSFSAGAAGAGLPGVRVTASFGVAARAGAEPLGPLMRRADEALYKAKQNGRDSVRLSYQKPEMPVKSTAANA